MSKVYSSFFVFIRNKIKNFFCRKKISLVNSSDGRGYITFGKKDNSFKKIKKIDPFIYPYF